jgi:hypothetical protein
LKRGKIRELLTKLTIVNAEDSLFVITQNFRSIVEFPGEGLGEKPSRVLEVNLGSSTGPNLGHNPIKIKKKKNVWGKFRYFRISFPQEVVGP